MPAHGASHIIMLLEVAPYSFRIARALRTKALEICARSKENSIQYSIYKPNCSKTDSEFSRVSFGEIPFGRLVVNILL